MTVGEGVDKAIGSVLVGLGSFAQRVLTLRPAKVEADLRAYLAMTALSHEAALVADEAEREVYEPDELWCAARVREQEENFGRAQHPLYREIQEQHEKKWGGFTPNCSDIGPVNDEYFADKAALDATVDTIEASTPSDMFSQLVDRRRIDISVRCTHCLEVFERPSKFTVHLLTCDGKRDVEYHSDASQVSAPGSPTGSERRPGVAESPRSPATPGQPQPDGDDPSWPCGCVTYRRNGKRSYGYMCAEHIYRCRQCKRPVFPVVHNDVARCSLHTQVDPVGAGVPPPGTDGSQTMPQALRDLDDLLEKRHKGLRGLTVPTAESADKATSALLFAAASQVQSVRPATALHRDYLDGLKADLEDRAAQFEAVGD
jgi:hypothetical protein